MERRELLELLTFMFIIVIICAAFFFAGMDFIGYRECGKKGGVYHYSKCYKGEVLE